MANRFKIAVLFALMVVSLVSALPLFDRPETITPCVVCTYGTRDCRAVPKLCQIAECEECMSLDTFECQNYTHFNETRYGFEDPHGIYYPLCFVVFAIVAVFTMFVLPD